MNPKGRRRRIPDITLEQYLLGELPEDEMVEMKRLLDEDPESRARLEALERSNREILEQYPPDSMSRQIQSKLEAQQKQSSFFQPRPMAAWVGAAAMAIVLLFTVLPGEFISWGPQGVAPEERIKGPGSQLKLYRKMANGSEALEDGTRVFPGDVLQLGYQAAGRAHGVVVSVDGRGTVTLHWPAQGKRSVPLEKGGLILLDFALELDDAPRWERFYFVTGDASFDVATVLQAAKQVDTERPVDRAESLELPKDLDQYVISVEKGTKP